MITSRRDYMMRIIEEVGRILARIAFKRRKGDSDDSALETVVFGFQRLFDLGADQIFQFTPPQHYEMLVRDEPPDFARDKVLLYAALCTEAGHIYARQGSRDKAAATFSTALNFALRARAAFPSEGWPDYAPSIPDLLDALGDAPLDPATSELLAAAGMPGKIG
ncbi:MAG TPA: hypothetical protein VHE13_00965 [Opitutus sp.]|nr:hypothetical protein [Opitutus sp.]